MTKLWISTTVCCRWIPFQGLAVPLNGLGQAAIMPMQAADRSVGWGIARIHLQQMVVMIQGFVIAPQSSKYAPDTDLYGRRQRVKLGGQAVTVLRDQLA